MEKQNLTLKTSEKTVEDQGELIPSSLLLKAGTYFGHRTKEWNPKMKKFIHSKRNGIHIIDVAKSLKALEWSYKIINQAAAKGATFIFVGTKKHGKALIKEEAQRSNSFFVSERWLGGTLTNSKTIFKQLKKLHELEAKTEEDFETYTKKETIHFKKELEKLRKNFEGIRDMKRQPTFMIAIDPMGDRIAVTEARKKGVKIIGIVDTNTDPDLVDLPIPANDDSVKSLKLILTILADAIVAAKGGESILAFQNNENFISGANHKERRDRDNSNYRRNNNYRGHSEQNANYRNPRRHYTNNYKGAKTNDEQ